MNIGLDIDGVLYPWHEGVWQKLKTEGYIDSNFDTFWNKEWIDMRDNRSTLFMNLVNDPMMYSSHAPYYGTRELLKTFDEAGHKLFYVSQRPRHLEFTTKAWVTHEKLPQEDNVFVVETSKRDAVIVNQIDLFVDDAPRHVEELQEFCKVVLVRRPYNRDIQENFECIDSILQLGEYINGKEV